MALGNGTGQLINFSPATVILSASQEER